MTATVHHLPSSSLAEQQRLFNAYTEAAQAFERKWPDVSIEDFRSVLTAHDRFALAFLGRSTG